MSVLLVVAGVLVGWFVRDGHAAVEELAAYRRGLALGRSSGFLKAWYADEPAEADDPPKSRTDSRYMTIDAVLDEAGYPREER